MLSAFALLISLKEMFLELEKVTAINDAIMQLLFFIFCCLLYVLLTFILNVRICMFSVTKALFENCSEKQFSILKSMFR